MQYQFFTYQKPFQIPFKTHHGIWSVREGIIVNLKNKKGNIGQGEIAPLPHFGTETLTEALNFCQQLSSPLSVAEIYSISDRLPCCQFAFGSAYEQVHHDYKNLNTTQLNYSYLLPTGHAAISAIQLPEAQNYRTFKWKIGIQSMTEERSLLMQLITHLPEQSKLRLDANGGLTLEDTKYWLDLADSLKQIEFIEQPLSTQDFSDLLTLLTLNQQFTTNIALDESVSSLRQLQFCYEQGWRGVYILKAAIMGYPHKLRHWLSNHKIDVVFSSVMETAIARNQVLAMASEWGNPQRAQGFGINHWFKDENLSS